MKVIMHTNIVHTIQEECNALLARCAVYMRVTDRTGTKLYALIAKLEIAVWHHLRRYIDRYNNTRRMQCIVGSIYAVVERVQNYARNR